MPTTYLTVLKDGKCQSCGRPARDNMWICLLAPTTILQADHEFGSEFGEKGDTGIIFDWSEEKLFCKECMNLILKGGLCHKINGLK